MKKWACFAIIFIYYAAILDAQSLFSSNPGTVTPGTIGLAIVIEGGGTNFSQVNAANYVIYFAKDTSTYIYGYNTTVSSPSLLTTYIDVPLGTPGGLYSLYIDSAAGGPLSLLSCLYVAVPSITAVSPDAGAKTAIRVNLDIAGVNTNFNPDSVGNYSVYLSRDSTIYMYGYGTSVALSSDLLTNIDIPLSVPYGQYDLHVLGSPGGPIVLPSGFSVPVPTIGALLAIRDTIGVPIDYGFVLIPGSYTNFVQSEAANYEVYFIHDSFIATGSGMSTSGSPTSLLVHPDLSCSSPSGWYNLYIDGYAPDTLHLDSAFYLIAGDPVSSYITTTNIDTFFTLATLNTGIPPFTFLWSLPDSGASILPNPTCTIGSTGSYSASVIVTDSIGCTDTAFITLTPDSTGYGSPCQAYFYVIPDTVPGYYIAIDCSTGTDSLSYLWSFGDGDTSTLQYPQYPYSAPGFYTVCLTIFSGTCVSSFCDSSFYAYKTGGGPMAELNVRGKNNTTNIKSIDNSATFSIYPNPATSVLELRTNSNYEIERSVIYNTAGQVVSSFGSVIELPVQGLDNGLYFIEVQTTSGKFHSDFVKQD